MSRKLKAVSISAPLLLEMLTDGYEVGKTHSIECNGEIPEGSTVVGSFTDNNSMTAYLVFQHDSFNVLAPGEKIPVVNVTFAAHYPDRALQWYIQQIYTMNNDKDFRLLDYSENELVDKRRYFLEKMLQELDEQERTTKELPI